MARDAGFYLISCVILAIFLIDGKIEWWERQQLAWARCACCCCCWPLVALNCWRFAGGSWLRAFEWSSGGKDNSTSTKGGLSGSKTVPLFPRWEAVVLLGTYLLYVIVCALFGTLVNCCCAPDTAMKKNLIAQAARERLKTGSLARMAAVRGRPFAISQVDLLLLRSDLLCRRFSG